MIDYNKLKVAELKEELKTRGIPLVGLKLKQQFIDKLVELDGVASGSSEDEPAAVGRLDREETQEDGAQGSQEAAKVEEGVIPVDTTREDLVQTEQGTPAPATEVEANNALPEVIMLSSKADDGLEPETVSALIGDEVSMPTQQLSETITTSTNDVSMPDASEKPKDDLQTATSPQPINEATQPTASDDKTEPEETSTASEQPNPESIEVLQHYTTHLNGAAVSGTSTPASQRPTVTELLEDSRKRKRRSVSPPPSAADIALKKAKTSDGSPIITKQESTLDKIQDATDAAEAIQSADGLNKNEYTNLAADLEEPEKMDMGAPDARPHATMADAPPNSAGEPEEPDRYVAPARHPATSSLYMRNFKRPLHIPSLRNHIRALAASPSSAADEDPITIYYLDNIRTHAFVSFTSISAASRVRSIMHDVRFPDEASRAPLFVDFVPDDQVQHWIDEETDAGGGGRGPGGKFEVVYHDTPRGVEARLQVVGAGAKDQGFGIRGSATAPPPLPVRSTSSADAAPPGIHPERALQIPRDNLAAPRGPARPAETKNGTGFKALDELFSFTSAKPKLYYKPVDARVAAERLERIRTLRGGHGRSGDEGMKRYTFESVGERARQEWIDKGPEFGFGRWGVERLSGRGGAGRGGGGGFGGGYRGRGGRGGDGGFDRGRGGGDSWRGSR